MTELDPTFPLPAGTGIPPVKQGEGAEILANTSMQMVEMPYRAFFTLWEHAERRGAEAYPKYVGGPLDDVAQLWLEAVHAFRSSANGFPLPLLTDVERPKKARKSNKVPRKSSPRTNGDRPIVKTPCPKCGHIEAKRVMRNGKKLWKCMNCRKSWPRISVHGSSGVAQSPSDPPTKPSKARKGSGGPTTASRKEKGAQKSTQKPEKANKRSQKKRQT